VNYFLNSKQLAKCLIVSGKQAYSEGLSSVQTCCRSHISSCVITKYKHVSNCVERLYRRNRQPFPRRGPETNFVVWWGVLIFYQQFRFFTVYNVAKTWEFMEFESD